MFADALNTQLLAALDRPDLRVVADRRPIAFDARLDTPFRADPGGRVVLGPACLGPERVCAFHIRHALELSMLLDAAEPLGLLDAAEPLGLLDAAGPLGLLDAAGPPDGDRRTDDPPGVDDLPVLAGLCAARTAARFWLLDAVSAAAPEPEPAAWLRAMAAATIPDRALLGLVWGGLRDLQEPSHRPRRTADGQRDGRTVTDRVVRHLAACWDLLGPAETLMAQGGDARLRVDPLTGLNGYGCSHRPRPWAITFASSTASSLSERGFGGAEAARKRLAVAILAGRAPAALRTESGRVRAAIAAHYGLADTAGIVLAASGTDSEVLALAVCALPSALVGAPAGAHGPARPISNILLAPEETGTGVPLAAAGRHFAGDTARGGTVEKGALIEGLPADTRVLRVAIRDRTGRLLAPAQVDAECERLAGAEAAQGRLVLLHRLDLSKTGLLGPSMACLQRLQERLGDQLELVVDACQARLDRRRPRDWLRRGWMVMVTGSKFFTGPPFCGALLLPPHLAGRLHGPGSLPAGLADYGGDADWPSGTVTGRRDHGQVRPGERQVNLGLVLRWQAALAEMAAFAQVPDRLARERTATFLAGVEAAIAASADMVAVDVPAPARETLPGPTGEPEPGWDQLQTIRSVLVLEPGAGASRRPLGMADARRLYRWLNADVAAALPPDAPEADRALARLLCHVGQPAPVADNRLDGAMAGALRISVGARLLSGEPSHEGLGAPARMAREIADVRRIIDKVGLLLRCWPALERLDPEPCFAPAATSG